MVTCPTCGSKVRVVSSGEGTNHYEPAAAPAEGLREALAGLVNAIEGAHPWTDDPYSVDDAMAQARAALARHESAGSE